MNLESLTPVEAYIGYSGFCRANAKFLYRGKQKRKIENLFYSLFAILKVDNIGWVLFDCGYSENFFSLTRSFPASIHKIITNVFVTEDDLVVNKLKQIGLRSADIKYIVLSHFHYDHIGGLNDFPDAKLICLKEAFSHYERLNRKISVFSGFLVDLSPEIIKSRMIFVEEFSTRFVSNIFGDYYDLFGNQMVYVVPLPGHAPGHCGVFFKTNNGYCFLVSDACWIKEAFEENVLPKRLTRVILYSWKDYLTSIKKIAHFYENYANCRIIPTHCKTTTDKIITDPKKIFSL